MQRLDFQHDLMSWSKSI